MQVVGKNGEKYRLPSKLNSFQTDMYVHLINWKWAHITKEPGLYRRKNSQGTRQILQYDAILPKSVRKSLPTIYPDILEDLSQHQEVLGFRVHEHFHHMASSQGANMNLFMPLLLHPKADEIFKRLKPDFNALATTELYKGFCLEFSGATSAEPKGPLGDKSQSAGTDADIAIAYLNHDGELSLWLIEHKLTEREFTQCGGARSKGRTSTHDCKRSFEEILQKKDYCYYHSVKKYQYWNLTEEFLDLYADYSEHPVCPFKGGMNQLWRNHLLAKAIGKQGKYKNTFFSVIKHPENVALDSTLDEYRQLTGNHPSFSVLDLRQVVDSALLTNDPEIGKWADWYTNLYKL